VYLNVEKDKLGTPLAPEKNGSGVPKRRKNKLGTPPRQKSRTMMYQT